MRTIALIALVSLLNSTQMSAQSVSDPVSNKPLKENKQDTQKAMTPPNLLQNPGGEDGLDNWTIEQGVAASLIAFDCNGIAPNSGDYYFAVGGLCEFSDVPGVLTQVIDIAAYADSVASGEFTVNFGGYFSNWVGEDLPEMRLYYLDDTENLIGFSNTVSSINDSWTNLTEVEILPANTAFIKVELKGTQLGGSFNDSYFDDLAVWLGHGELDPPTSIAAHTADQPQLEVMPNPVQTTATISLPNDQNGTMQFRLTDLRGAIVPCHVEYFADRIVIENTMDLQGLYIFTVKNNDLMLGYGKVIFKP